MKKTLTNGSKNDTLLFFYLFFPIHFDNQPFIWWALESLIGLFVSFFELNTLMGFNRVNEFVTAFDAPFRGGIE